MTRKTGKSDALNLERARGFEPPTPTLARLAETRRDPGKIAFASNAGKEKY
jgi:hypothetical protein